MTLLRLAYLGLVLALVGGGAVLGAIAWRIVNDRRAEARADRLARHADAALAVCAGEPDDEAAPLSASELTEWRHLRIAARSMPAITDADRHPRPPAIP